MSYARWGEDGSDVYVFGASASLDEADDYLVCMGCKLEPTGDAFEGSFTCKTPAEMIAHLREHRERGHVVPARAFLQLQEESEET